MTTNRDTQRRGQTRGRKTSARTLGIRQKQTRAVELRCQGWTLAAIAEELGYRDPSASMKAIEAALGRVESENVDQLRALHGQRIADGYRIVAGILSEIPPELPDPDVWVDSEWLAALALRLTSDRDMKLKALDRLGRLMEREAKLHGLDAPTKQEITGDTIATIVVDPRTLPIQLPDDDDQ